MLTNLLKDKKIILGSASPRRQELLRSIINDFEIKISDLKEKYPKNLKGKEISEFLAIQKSDVFSIKIKTNEILITADTIVIKGERILNKPENKPEAKEMLAFCPILSIKSLHLFVCEISKRSLYFHLLQKFFSNRFLMLKSIIM